MSNPFYLTDGALAIFNTGAACSQNIQTLHIIRCFAGAFGPSPLTNAGGRIADMFGQRLVGLAMSLFVTAPFIGPALGPIGGGVYDRKGRLEGTVVIPETYALVMFRKKATEAVSNDR